MNQKIWTNFFLEGKAIQKTKELGITLTIGSPKYEAKIWITGVCNFCINLDLGLLGNFVYEIIEL